jgi:hypothetical protein
MLWYITNGGIMGSGTSVIDSDGPPARFQQAEDKLQQGRLSSPVGTDYRDKVTLVYREINIVQDILPAGGVA